MTTRFLFDLNNNTVLLLRNQIIIEYNASAQYLTMASWCEVNGYQGSAKFFYKQSEEERMHMLKIFKFLTSAGVAVSHPPSIMNIITEFNSLRHVFELTMKSEIMVTSSIHRIAQGCTDNKDYSTLNFIQWYITEQIEEEATIGRILDLFRMIGEEGIGLYTIDKEIGALVK